MVGARSRGATVIEKHLTFDKSDPRSRANAGALEPDEFAAMVHEIRELERAVEAPPADELEAALAAAREWAASAIVAARDLPTGHLITRADLAFKRPSRGGIAASEVDSVVGRALARAVAADEQIHRDDLT